MHKNIALSEPIKIEYEHPLDVVKLFAPERISYTFNHVLARFVDACSEARELGLEYEEPIFLKEFNSVYNIEYSFFIEVLGELVNNKKLFYHHFTLQFDDTKNPQFLIAGLLEDYLGLVKMNTKKFKCPGKGEYTLSPSFVTPLILKYSHYVDSSERFIQMNAVNFRIDGLKKIVDEHIYIAVINLCIMCQAKCSFSYLQFN